MKKSNKNNLEGFLIDNLREVNKKTLKEQVLYERKVKRIKTYHLINLLLKYDN